MSTYIEIIDQLLLNKRGKKAFELDYMELPEEDARYNIKMSIGNIHLTSKRVKTPRKADNLVNKFLKTEIP